MLQNITKLLKWVVDLYMYTDLKIFVGTAIMQKSYGEINIVLLLFQESKLKHP